MTYFCECGCGQAVELAQTTNRKLGRVKGEPNRFVRGHNSRFENSFQGKEHTAETKQRISQSRSGILTGVSHHNWKGDDAGYLALHKWVNRHRPRVGKCSECGAAGYTEYANLSGLYFRTLDDYAEMCVPCHRRYDAQ